MSNGNDDYLRVPDDVSNEISKDWAIDAALSPFLLRPEQRVLRYSLNYMVHIVPEVATEARLLSIVPECCFGEFFFGLVEKLNGHFRSLRSSSEKTSPAGRVEALALS